MQREGKKLPFPLPIVASPCFPFCFHQELTTITITQKNSAMKNLPNKKLSRKPDNHSLEEVEGFLQDKTKRIERFRSNPAQGATKALAAGVRIGVWT